MPTESGGLDSAEVEDAEGGHRAHIGAAQQDRTGERGGADDPFGESRLPQRERERTSVPVTRPGELRSKASTSAKWKAKFQNWLPAAQASTQKLAVALRVFAAQPTSAAMMRMKRMLPPRNSGSAIGLPLISAA